MATPARDPNYRHPGIRIFVHSAIGFFPERKVRVAWCIQIGKHILEESPGELCFYATQGQNPNTKQTFQEKGPIDVVTFNDSKD